MIKEKGKTSAGILLLSAFQSFDPFAWLLILLAVITSGIIYHSTDYLTHRGNPAERKEIGDKFIQDLLQEIQI